jgi:membrane associated rhomboid family serine protease
MGQTAKKVIVSLRHSGISRFKAAFAFTRLRWRVSFAAMGIYDRDYMSDEDSPYGAQPGPRFTAVNSLIIANIVVWFLWQFAGDNHTLWRLMDNHFTVSRAGLLEHFRFHTLFTAALSHENIWHIFFNLVFFWCLGKLVEKYFSFRKFLALYFFCGLAGFVCQVALAPERSLGASGAIMGVAVAAAFYAPNLTIYLMGVVPIKLWLLTALYVFFDLFGLANPGEHIARGAHLGGAVAGYLFWKIVPPLDPNARSAGIDWGGSFRRLRSLFRRRPRLRLVKKSAANEKTAPAGEIRSSAAHPTVDSETARRVDKLLDKIHQHGMGVLTKEERAFLSESSQKYKKAEDRRMQNAE